MTTPKVAFLFFVRDVPEMRSETLPKRGDRATRFVREPLAHAGDQERTDIANVGGGQLGRGGVGHRGRLYKRQVCR
jgi:hypothetical protein